MPDLRVIACNYLRPTRACAGGAKAYVLLTNPGNGGDRLCVLARSRNGRWIEKWEDTRRLGRFRLVTIPPEHPRRADLALADRADLEGEYERWCERMNGPAA